jgi:hypothetical protein
MDERAKARAAAVAKRRAEQIVRLGRGHNIVSENEASTLLANPV